MMIALSGVSAQRSSLEPKVPEELVKMFKNQEIVKEAVRAACRPFGRYKWYGDSERLEARIGAVKRR